MHIKLSRLFRFVLCLTVIHSLNAQVAPTPAAARLQGNAQRARLHTASPFNATSFRNIGPSVMSGRVVDIEANPADPTEFYVAYATGGLWHTVNNGISFRPLFDSSDVIVIGDIAVNWTNRHIWVGTGEVNSSRSSYAGLGIYKSLDSGRTWKWAGLPESHHIGKVQLHPTDPNTAWVAVLGHLYSPNRERGVFKTTDGGTTWQHTLYVDNNTGAVELEMNPQNPMELYAATWYRTRSAWDFVESGATSGIYKSTDGGTTWQHITRSGSGFPTGAGVGRIGLAVYPKNGQIIYAVVDNQDPRPDTARRDTATYALEQLKNLSTGAFAQLDERRLDTFLRQNRLYPRYTARGIKELVAKNELKPTVLYDYLYVNTGFEGTPKGAEVYRSNDGGRSWAKTHTKDIPIFFTYGYYFSKIYVSPVNPEKVYVLGFSSQLSTDGGKNWTNMDKPNVHADHHALWVNPARDSHLINGNDGGVNITYDNGQHWYKANSPSVGQFYAITVDGARPYNVYGGLQDNGVWYGPSNNRESSEWHESGNYAYKSIYGGDGMQVQVDPRNNTTVYTGSQFGNYARLNREGARDMRRLQPRHNLGEFPLRFNWQTPILLSPHNPDILYFGSNRLHRSFNRGDSMTVLSGDLTGGRREGDVPFGTLTTITESPLRFGLLYTGSDDGQIHVSRDAGATFTRVGAAPAGRKGAATAGLPQGLWVSRVIASRFREGRVYATLNGYRNDHFDPYVYVSEDYGATWTRLGTDLPMEPVNVVREDPKNENILYVGTDGGLYVSTNRGKSFAMWRAGLPASVPVHDIAIQERENEIVLGTHGRSLYVAPLKDIQAKAANQ